MAYCVFLPSIYAGPAHVGNICTRGWSCGREIRTGFGALALFTESSPTLPDGGTSPMFPDRTSNDHTFVEAVPVVNYCAPPLHSGVAHGADSGCVIPVMDVATDRGGDHDCTIRW